MFNKRCNQDSEISESSMLEWSQTEITTELEIEEEFCAVVESIKSEEERNVDIKPATLPDKYQLQRVQTRSEYSEPTLQSNDDVCLLLRCRLCASPNNDMVEIFSSLEMTKDILEKIEYALPITVKETDALPKRICRLCLEELERSYRFCKTVAEAEKRLLVLDKLACMKSEETDRNDESSPLNNAQQGSTESDNVDGPSETNSDMEMNKNKSTIIHKDAPNLSNCSVVLSILKFSSKNNLDAKNCRKCSSKSTKDRNTDERIRSENRQASTCDPEVNMENPPAQSREQLHKCNLCAKTFNQKSHLTQHRVVHTGEKPHKCNVCAKSFTQKSHLTRHSEIHTDNGPGRYRCNVCAKTFTQKARLTRHSVIHTNKRLWPHKCNVCAKAFYYKFNLARHSLIHTGERVWPHKCNVCAKAFNHKSHLTRHSESHKRRTSRPRKL